MIRITIIAIATFVLGFAAFTGVNHYPGAVAAPPPKTPTPTPGPAEPLHVIEQNLDANGYIRVTQQGPVDVNVVSASPTRVIQLLDGATLSGPGEISSSFADVRDCARLDLFGRGSLAQPAPSWGSVQVSFEADISIDGVADFGNSGIQQSQDSGQTLSFGPGQYGPAYAVARLNFANGAVARAPYVAVRAQLSEAWSATVSVWLYCSD